MNPFRLCRRLCSIGLALALLPALATASSFIGPLSVTPGPSTVPANGDVNPYGVAVVPRSSGKLVRGHVLVSNFNNGQNLQGTGTTIVDIRPDGTQFPHTWLVPVLILGVPIFDTTLVSISRARRGLLPFTSPGKDHMAHRLSNLGLGHRRAVLVMYFLAAVLGGIALLIPNLSPTTVYTIAGILVVAALCAIFLLEGLPYERQVKLHKPPLPPEAA